MMGDRQRSLFGTVTPHDGETLLSIISRSAEANVHPRLESFLALAGVQTRKPEFVPFTKIEQAEGLAQRLGLGADAVLRRTHRALSSHRHGWVDWYGTSLPRVFIDASAYRFSPRSLQKNAFQRAVWTVKPLKCCAESMEVLVDCCPHCKWQQRWKYRSPMDICEKCRRPLFDSSCDMIDVDIQPDIKFVANLLDPCNHVREKCLNALPEPFKRWDAGQVFVAIVDLGAVMCAPELARKIWNGDFSDYSIHYLIAGLRLIRDWQKRFETLLAEVVDTKSSNLRKCLGPLSRFFYATAAPSTLRDHIRAEVPDMLKRMMLPAQGRSQHADWLDVEGTITNTAGAIKYGLDKKTIRRLRAAGLCTRGTHLLDDAALGRAVSTLRSAASAAECASAIGLPQHCVSYIAARGLLKEASDKGAIALAGEVIYDRSQLDLLVAKLRSVVPLSQGPGIPVKRFLLGRLHPEDWVDVVQGVLDGKIKVVDTPNGVAAFKTITIDAQDAERFAARIPARAVPTSIWLTYDDVSDLIGLQPPAITAAVKKQLFLKAVRLRGFMRIALDDVQALYAKYVWHDRLKSTVSARVFASVMCEAGFPPAANLAGLNLWLVEDVKNAELPSQSNWEIERANPIPATSLAHEIYAAVHDRKLKEPFGPDDIKTACPGWVPQTYKNILPRYSVGNPSKAAELFQRIGHGRYKTVAARKQPVACGANGNAARYEPLDLGLLENV